MTRIISRFDPRRFENNARTRDTCFAHVSLIYSSIKKLVRFGHTMLENILVEIDG